MNYDDLEPVDDSDEDIVDPYDELMLAYEHEYDKCSRERHDDCLPES